MRKPSLYATYFWEHISHVTGLCIVLSRAHPALTQNFMSSNLITGCYTAAGKQKEFPGSVYLFRINFIFWILG